MRLSKANSAPRGIYKSPGGNLCNGEASGKWVLWDMNGHKTQCVANKEAVPVYTGVALGVAVPSPWIYEVEGRGGVGKKLRAGGTS